jgi:hypothetical protein
MASNHINNDSNGIERRYEWFLSSAVLDPQALEAVPSRKIDYKVIECIVVKYRSDDLFQKKNEEGLNEFKCKYCDINLMIKSS